ncbi:hypothetical protein [Streptomyces sp. NPDC048527]|uniref:hypothetical protein n=1 Tax=Streptomyces sp. NPDC048527 TaxID=3365568 RepID=UPI0037131066
MSIVDSPHTGSTQHEPLTAEEPVDYTAVRNTVDDINGTPLAALDRTGIDERTAHLTGLVHRMIREDYPTRAPHVTAVFRIAYRVLDSPTRPTGLDSDWAAWKHLQNLSCSAAALADVLNPQPR